MVLELEDELQLQPGNWLVINCAQRPSQSNCHMVMMVPEAQENDLMEAAVQHAIHKHGEQDTPELRESLHDQMQKITIS